MANVIRFLHETPLTEERIASANCRNNSKTVRRSADSRLMMEINARLKSHPDLDSRRVYVKVHRGEVVLLGIVSDAELKQLAETIAGGIEGVRCISNKLIAQFDGILFG